MMPHSETAGGRLWGLGGFAVLAVSIAVGFVVKEWLRKPPDRAAVAANFKKELAALGGWENVEWAWARDDVLAEGLAHDADNGSYLVYADHRVGDTVFRFYVAFWHNFPKLSVGVRRAADYEDTTVRGYIDFENCSITEKDMEKLPSDDRGQILTLATELAEAARRSTR